MRLMIWIKYSKISDGGKLYWGFQWSSWCFELKWSWFMLHVICNTVEYSYIAYCNFRYKIEGIEIKKGFLCLELKSFSSVFVPVLSLVLLWVYLRHPRGKFRNFKWFCYLRHFWVMFKSYFLNALKMSQERKNWTVKPRLLPNRDSGI